MTAHTVLLTWESSSASETKIKTITTSFADAAAAPIVYRDGRERRKEGGDKCVVWANCCLVDIKSSIMVGVVCVCVEENRRWSEQPLPMGAEGATMPAVL